MPRARVHKKTLRRIAPCGKLVVASELEGNVSMGRGPFVNCGRSSANQEVNDE